MKPLGELVNIIKGGKAAEVFNKPKEGAFRYIQIEDLRSNENIKYALDDTGTLAEKSDVLIAWDGANAGIVSFGLEGYIGSTIAILRPRQKGINTPYLGYFLRSKFDEIQKNTTGATIPHVNRSVLESYRIPLPQLAEQQRIAIVLQKVDQLRHLRHYTRKLSDGYLQSVFLEMFGDPASNPRGWNVVVLKELIRPQDKINYGVVQPGENFPGGVPIVRVGDFDNIPEKTDGLKRIDPTIESEYKRSRLRGDEILIGCVGTIGKIALVDQRLQGFNIVRATARVPINNSINRLFLAEYLKTQFIQNYFDKETRTVSQPTLNIEHIEETPVPVPPLAEQERFTRIVNRYNCLRARQQESERQTEHLFQSLLQRAFQGEL